MKLLKQNQIKNMIDDCINKLSDTVMVKYNREEFSEVLHIPNNEELICIAFKEVRENNLLRWYKLFLFYKNDNFIVIPYLNRKD